jgi:hypothetical protein
MLAKKDRPMSIRTLLWLLGALALALAAGNSASALEATKGVATASEGVVVKTEGRKGTRVYTQDQSVDYGTLVEGQEKAAATATGDATSNQKLDQCMASWDTGTHITQANWRKICERQLADGAL